ncbi:AlpA family phage regulatory protein [Mesorhizobium sp.]|uniref:helix-turn-helix transcriptional regulator n=1 Tax=Mesorhizobium sp. TaxID=1871066 RepID=UPI00257A3AA4|nr:AlpA family phage regulatory protein [Mesorhizobium sp.]
MRNTQETRPTLLNGMDVKKLAPVSDMTLWRWIKAGAFPKPIKITSRNYWRADEITAWLDKKSAERTA